MTHSVQVIACGTASTQTAVTANVSAALLARNLCVGTVPAIVNVEVSSTNEQVQLQAATRHCMHAATTSNRVTVALCAATDTSAAGGKRKRDDETNVLVYVVVAPVPLLVTEDQVK